MNDPQMVGQEKEIMLPAEPENDVRQKLWGDMIPDGELWRVRFSGWREFQFQGDKHATVFARFSGMDGHEMQWKQIHTAQVRKATGVDRTPLLVGKSVLLKRGPVPSGGQYHCVVILPDQPTLTVSRDFAATTQSTPEASALRPVAQVPGSEGVF
jgi:hypothetical protein